jgi:hypothetical protein
LLSFGSEKRPANEFNFYGDIINNHVDCIRADENLPYNIEAMFGKERSYLGLTLSDCGIEQVALSLFRKIFHSRFPSISREGNALLNAKTLHAQAACNTSIAQNQATALKDFTDHLAAAIEFGSEIQDAIPSFISFDNAGRSIADSLQLIHRRNDETNFLEGSAKVTGTASLAFTESRQSHAGIKRFLRVTKKFSSVFADHVYTLQSLNGWYKITPAMVISKNCRCRAVPVIRFNED